MQTDVTLLPKNSQHWWMLLRFAHSLACWCLSLGFVAQSLKPVKLFSQQLPTVLLLRDRLRVAQQCWIRLHCSSHIVGARHVRAWFYELYPSHAIAQKLSVSNGNGFSNKFKTKRENSHLTPAFSINRGFWSKRAEASITSITEDN